MIDCIAQEFEIDIDRVLIDSAYTNGKNLTAAEHRQIDLIGPLAETKRENNPAERSDLTQPVAADQLDQLPINPQTKQFDKAAFVYDEATDSYYCPAGKVLSHRTTEKSTQEAYSRRQHFGETPFAVIKVHFDLRRFLLRGLEGVKQEWRWAATGFNLKKRMSHLAKLRAEGTGAAAIAVE